MIPPIIIAGPTASGKSAVALELAARIDGEIVSVDSMQVYQGLDIGTAKPTRADLDAIPHHLIDVVPLSITFDAAAFVGACKRVVEEVQNRGKVPILCGGTGLYFTSWLNGLGTSPAPDPALRTLLESTPLPELLDELSRKDPVTFDEIDLNNPRRVIRAIEVIRLTGRPFSLQRANWPERAPSLAGRSFGLQRSREDLRRRIDRRIEAMFGAGLVEETRQLVTKGLLENRTAMQALGYRQVAEHLAGKYGRLETIEQVKIKTRQFAKRQMTWFQRHLDLIWIEVGEEESPKAVSRQILASLGTSRP
jgi:tRNA dimethylallyltransferase